MNPHVAHVAVLNQTRHSIAAYVQVVFTRGAFRNASGSLRGEKQTPRDIAIFVASNTTRKQLSRDSYLAFAMDEPDYVVSYQGVPMLWHSTVRGIKHRKDNSAHEWVMAVWAHHDEAIGWLQFYLKLSQEIVAALNDRLVASRPER